MKSGKNPSVDCYISYAAKYPGQTDMNNATYCTGVYASYMVATTKATIQVIGENISNMIEEALKDPSPLKKYVSIIQPEVAKFPSNYYQELSDLSGLSGKTICNDIDRDFRPVLSNIFGSTPGPIKENIKKAMEGKLVDSFHKKTAKWNLLTAFTIILIIILILAFFLMM